MNDDQLSVWNEAIETYFKVLFCHYPGGTEENSENFRKAGDTAEFLILRTQISRITASDNLLG